MKVRSLCILIFLLLVNIVVAQVPSSCDAPRVLLDTYKDDINYLAMSEIYVEGSDNIAIDSSFIIPLQNGLAAIFNAEGIPEVDSVFNIHCVRNRSALYAYKNIWIELDTTYDWTAEWINENTTTNYSELDSFMSQYGLTVTNSFWNSESVVIRTDQSLNIVNVAKELTRFDGIIKATSGGSGIGDGSRIIYLKTGLEQYFTFKLKWGDCPAGCIYFYAWKFKVYPDCSVEFLGTEFSKWEEIVLPNPRNCDLALAINEPIFPNNFDVYPNPSTSMVNIVTEKMEPYNLIMKNAVGQIVLRKNLMGNDQIDISHLTSGLYFLEFYNEEGERIGFEKLIR